MHQPKLLMFPDCDHTGGIVRAH